MIKSDDEEDEKILQETFKDKFTLSPLEKYLKYGKWPYQMVFGVALVIMTSFQAIFVSEVFMYDNSEQMETWNQIFLNDDNGETVYYTLEAFSESITQTMNNLQSINDISTQQVDDTYLAVVIYVNYMYPFRAFLNKQLNFKYDIDVSQGIIEPFNMSDGQSIKEFFQRANALTLEIKNITLKQNSYDICWDISIRYIYKDFAYIESQLDSYGGKCLYLQEQRLLQDEEQYFKRRLVQNKMIEDSYERVENTNLQITVAVLAILDFIFSIKYIYEIIDMYTKNIFKKSKVNRISIPDYKMRKNENLITLRQILQDQKPWEKLTFREKILFFDLFLPLRIIGNVCQIIGSGLMLTQGFTRIGNISNYDENFIGLGCWFAWFSMLKYLEYNQSLRIIVNVLEASAVPLMMSLINFLPVFFAYSFLGHCLFNFCSRFETPFVIKSMVTLFALFFADALDDILVDMSRGVDFYLVLIYVASYVILFLFLVFYLSKSFQCNNIIISLIKEQLEQRQLQINSEKQFITELERSTSKKDKPLPINYSEASENDQKMDSRSDMKYSYKSEIQDSAMKQSIYETNKRTSIQIQTVNKLALTLSRKESGTKVNQNLIQKDWERLAGQEIQKNYIYNAMKSLINQIKSELFEIEKDIWNDIEFHSFKNTDRREIVSLYCSILKKINKKFNNLYQKTKDIEHKWKGYKDFMIQSKQL